jgi:hypothetical protein
VHAPDRARVPRGPGSIASDHQARGEPTAGTTGTGVAWRAEGSARPASLMHAYIVVSLMAGVRPEEARAIEGKQDVDLDGNPPSVAMLRADRAGGDTKTPKSRRALKLAQMAVGALRSGRWTRRLSGRW